jgi:uncharacterized repeat protein (TIGR01451 family)
MSAWSTMNVDKIVTYADLAAAISSGDLYQKTPFTSTPKGIKKSDLDTYIFIDTSNAFYVSRTANQVLPRKAITGIPPIYNLNLTSSASPTTVTAGNNVTYTVNVRNDESYATSAPVPIVFTFAPNTSFSSISVTAGVIYTYSGNTLTITSVIAAGATVVITVVCSTTRPTSDGAGTQAIPLTARYTPSNSTTTEPYLVWAIFEVEKIARENDGTTQITSGNVAFNQTFIYFLRVRSATASPLYPTNVTLTDTLPSNLTFVEFFNTSGWTTSYNSTTRVATLSKSGALHSSIFNTFISLGIRVTASVENVTLNNTFTASAANTNNKTSANFALNVGFNTAPVLTSQGYSTCSSCVTYTVFRDTNPNSSTFNRYFVNGVNVGTTAPSNGACDYSSQYENTFQILCSGCNSFFVFAHNYSAKPCYTGAPFQVNGVDYYSNPATGACNTSANYSSYVGIMCIGCTEYAVYQNTNSCFTGNQFQSNGVTYSSNPVTGSCSSSANYAMYVGQTCIGCVTYSVFQNVNSCFTGNQWQAGGTTYASNPTTSACNTSQNLVSQGYNTCSACTTYAVFRDTSVCSSTYNMYFVNGVNVGFSAPVSGACFYGQNLEFQGYNTCISCSSVGVYRDTSVCSSTYNNYFANGVNLGTSAPSSAPCGCCEEISVSNNSGGEVYIEWLPCNASSNNSYFLQVGEIIYFCRNTSASFNTGGLGYSVGGACSYSGYTIITT